MALAVERALALLKLFTVSTPEIGLSEAARLAGESKATVYRLLTTLCDSGLVEPIAARKTYRLGPAVLDLARVREATVPLLSVVQPVLAQLLERTGETCHFSRFNGAAMAVVASAESRKVNRITMQGVDALPVCTTAAGQVFLAFASADAVDEALTKSNLGAQDRATLAVRLEAIRRQGYATVEIFEDEEIFGVACPVIGNDGRFLGALAVIIPPNRITDELFQTVLKDVRDGSAIIARGLGG